MRIAFRRVSRSPYRRALKRWQYHLLHARTTTNVTLNNRIVHTHTCTNDSNSSRGRSDELGDVGMPASASTNSRSFSSSSRTARRRCGCHTSVQRTPLNLTPASDYVARDTALHVTSRDSTLLDDRCRRARAFLRENLRDKCTSVLCQAARTISIAHWFVCDVDCFVLFVVFNAATRRTTQPPRHTTLTTRIISTALPRLLYRWRCDVAWCLQSCARVSQCVRVHEHAHTRTCRRRAFVLRMAKDVSNTTDHSDTTIS
jgi:hypothetical protein